MPEITLHAAARAYTIAQLAKAGGATGSTSEALRLIAQRGLKIDGEVVTDKALSVAAGRHGRRAGRQAQVRPGDREASVTAKRGRSSGQGDRRARAIVSARATVSATG